MSGFPTAAGHPNQSGISIPRLYAATLLIEFYIATVFGAIATTEFEGELKKFGDTLRIRSLPEINAKAYVKGQKLDYDNPDPSFVDLVIDKGLYWAFAQDLLDMKQYDYAAGQKWGEHASTNLKVKADRDILGNIYADVDPANKGNAAGKESGSLTLGTTGTPVALTRSTILEWIVEQAGVALDEQNVPDENRWMVLPSWACGILKTSDLRDASITGDGKSALRNGRIGMIDRFEIYRSNNLDVVTDGGNKVTNAVFGHKSCLAFAAQMLETESLKNPDAFGDLNRQLMA